MSDLISRQDAIEYFMINTNWHDEDEEPIEDADEKRALLTDYFNGVPSANSWIPCSERLPEEDGQYLITVKYVHVDGYDDIYAEHGEWTDGKWDMFCFGHCGQVETILAWMPLPKPWKGDPS